MPNLRREEYDAAQREDFYTFLARAFYELNPSARFLGNWHLELVAAKLAACFEGRIRRLAITLPPRHLKSHCASVALPAFWLGQDPAARIMCVSYGQELAEKLSRDCRALMASAWYRRLFGTRLSPERRAVAEFTTDAGGYRLATSVGGVVTGRGADVIIIDDPMKPEQALSEAQRRAVNEFYDHTLYSRLDDKNRGRVVLIMQRLHEDDLLGHVLRQEDWDVVALPAIAERDEAHLAATRYGRRSFGRPAGAALHPERESLDTLARIRATIGEWNFAGQYQQAPAPLGGGIVKREWLLFYENHLLPEFDRVLQSWDTASKPSELADYSVGTTWGVKGARLFLLNVFRRRLDYPSLKRAVCEQAGLYQPGTILIEDKSSGTQLIQELAHEGLYAVTRYQPTGDKVMRLHAQSGLFENGLVHLPKEAHWLDAYVQELTAFPRGRHDDQVDATAQALDWLKRQSYAPGTGIIEYYRREFEKREPRP
jgi:predicted phage terminase large subunit-like protein